jgi:hypothetical protein
MCLRKRIDALAYAQGMHHAFGFWSLTPAFAQALTPEG